MSSLAIHKMSWRSSRGRERKVIRRLMISALVRRFRPLSLGVFAFLGAGTGPSGSSSAGNFAGLVVIRGMLLAGYEPLTACYQQLLRCQRVE